MISFLFAQLQLFEIILTRNLRLSFLRYNGTITEYFVAAVIIRNIFRVQFTFLFWLLIESLGYLSSLLGVSHHNHLYFPAVKGEVPRGRKHYRDQLLKKLHF